MASNKKTENAPIELTPAQVAERDARVAKAFKKADGGWKVAQLRMYVAFVTFLAGRAMGAKSAKNRAAAAKWQDDLGLTPNPFKSESRLTQSVATHKWLATDDGIKFLEILGREHTAAHNGRDLIAELEDAELPNTITKLGLNASKTCGTGSGGAKPKNVPGNGGDKNPPEQITFSDPADLIKVIARYLAGDAKTDEKDSFVASAMEAINKYHDDTNRADRLVIERAA